MQSSSSANNSGKPFHYGGQAVYEGVMIRGRENVTTAVRTVGGNIAIDASPLSTLYRGRLRTTALIRGVIVLIETLVLGTRALMRSANLALGEEEEISSGLMWGTMVLGLALGVGLFFVAPLFIAKYLIFPFTSPLLGNVLEGILRVAMFIAYLRVVRFLPDLRRIYAYHGAEHKVVNAYEEGAELNVEGVTPYSTAHLRCGTSFLLIVLVVSILVYALVGRPALWITLASRLLLLPVIVAIGYEAVRLAADHGKSLAVRWLLAPGLALQAMTTAEPSADQIEVALAAMTGALEADSGGTRQVEEPVQEPIQEAESPS